jgi:hypothetical protein
MKKVLLTLAAVAALVAPAASTASAASSPVRVDFVKHWIGPGYVFQGTASGAVNGGLTSQLVSLNDVSGPIYHVTFDWIISAGAQSFTARTSGTWNTLTGQVVMDGTVISSGYLSGAQVHEEGQLIDPATLTFAGFLQLMPATAG